MYVHLIVIVMLFVLVIVLANDIYVTQSGVTLTLHVLQDGQNNTVGNSTTSSSVIGVTIYY